MSSGMSLALRARRACALTKPVGGVLEGWRWK